MRLLNDSKAEGSWPYELKPHDAKEWAPVAKGVRPRYYTPWPGDADSTKGHWLTFVEIYDHGEQFLDDAAKIRNDGRLSADGQRDKIRALADERFAELERIRERYQKRCRQFRRRSFAPR